MDNRTRDQLRDRALNASRPQDYDQQLKWFQSSLDSHRQAEQNLMAQFKLLDYLGHVDKLESIVKDLQQIRTAIQFLEEQLVGDAYQPTV